MVSGYTSLYFCTFSDLQLFEKRGNITVPQGKPSKNKKTEDEKMERIKRVVITWEDENWEYELELTGAEAEHFTESEAAAYAAPGCRRKRNDHETAAGHRHRNRGAGRPGGSHGGGCLLERIFLGMRERSINRSQAFHSAPRAERLLCWCMTRRICWISVSGTPNACNACRLPQSGQIGVLESVRERAGGSV